jgi:hypothetical protein
MKKIDFHSSYVEHYCKLIFILLTMFGLMFFFIGSIYQTGSSSNIFGIENSEFDIICIYVLIFCLLPWLFLALHIAVRRFYEMLYEKSEIKRLRKLQEFTDDVKKYNL